MGPRVPTDLRQRADVSCRGVGGGGGGRGVGPRVPTDPRQRADVS